MSKIPKNRFEVQLMAVNYIRCKTALREVELAIKSCPPHRLESHQTIVKHIEHVIEGLSDKYKLIIYNEVILGRTGKWYLEYISASTYYRIRDKAYEQFLRCL